MELNNGTLFSVLSKFAFIVFRFEYVLIYVRLDMAFLSLPIPPDNIPARFVLPLQQGSTCCHAVLMQQKVLLFSVTI